jgi:hypothetical protein
MLQSSNKKGAQKQSIKKRLQSSNKKGAQKTKQKSCKTAIKNGRKKTKTIY